MEVKVNKEECIEGVEQSEEEMGMRKGPWSVEEDTTLINYVATHGDCRWNSLARSAGTYTILFSALTTLSISLS